MVQSNSHFRRFIFLCFGFLVVGQAGARAAVTGIEIPIFAGGYGTAFYEETAREFEKLRPEVSVRVHGDPRISDKLRVRIIAGSLPDAMLPRDVLIPALVHAGKLRDLTTLLDGPNWEGDARWRDTFLPGALDSWKIEGGIYGVPVSYACWAIFYNRGLFRTHGWSVPETWDEFFALCEKIRAAGIAPVSLTGIYGNYPDSIVRSAYYNLAGPEGWERMGRTEAGAYSDPRYIRAAGVLQRLAEKDLLAGWEGATHTGAQTAFAEGRAAMCVSGSWMLYEMGDKLPPGLDVGAMNFPTFADGIADPTTIQASTDNLFCFVTGDPKREAATLDFLRYLTSRERAHAFVRRIQSPTAIKGVQPGEFSPRMRGIAELILNARHAFTMPQVMLQPPPVRQALVDERLQLMAGRISPGEYATRIEAAAAVHRARIANPDRVEYRHAWAGGLLLAGLLALLAWLFLKPVARLVLRRRRPPGASVHRDSFGPLRARTAGVFLVPSFLIYAALVLVPGAVAAMWAFTRWDGMGQREWIGLLNFRWLIFESDTFWMALRNNLFLMAVPAAIVLPISLALAYLLHRRVPGAGFFRSVFLFPNLLGGIAATLLWMSAYEPHGGLVNAALAGLGRVLGSETLMGFESHPWLAPRNLYWSLVPIYVWMACGFNLVLFLAAMEGIDASLYEAAELDGASRLQQFLGITLPLIWQTVVVALVFLVIAGLNAFEMIWLLTSQDPDSRSHTLGTLMVSSMFKEFQVGRATAIAVVLLVLVLAGSALLMRLLRREQPDM
ncbi:MAG: extracellular solute-binding protein [Opitutaceae bacterium]|nr:extracellular solute-binding protein [Opitutaceae bacterium]